MNVSRKLMFQWTTWGVVFGLLIILVTAVFSYITWKRSGYRRSIAALEILRLVIVSMGALLFNQPEWVEEYRPEEKSRLAVLWDGSRSMETQDVVVGNGSERKQIARKEAISELIDPKTWKGLPARTEVVIEPFATEANQGTDLAAPLTNVTEKHKNLRGVVLISDGDWNTGKPPAHAAALLRQKNIPVFVVPVGSKTRLPDVELVNIDLPTFGIAGKTVRIPFAIESSLPREYLTTVQLKSSDGTVASKDVRIAPMGRTTDAITWKPATTGDFTVSLSIPKHSEELLTDNNQQTAPISIRQEKLKVLVVESYPRWEYRYLRNALSRDPGVEVACLLFHPGLSKVGGGNQDYIKQFPEHLDELSKFDVVFLGDVGTTDNQLTPEQCRLLKGLVEKQASGLVFMPGWQGRQLTLMETELGDLCPVQLDPAQPGGWGSRTPGHFELTETGRRSLLTKLADTQDDNMDVWEKLPGFQWYAPVLRAKAGTEVLCVHQGASNEFGHLPLLVTRTFGAGKVLFMGTDGAWRWRKGVEDKYHYRFWGQVVRWMAYQRNMAKGESMRLYHTPDQPQAKQTLTLHAHVMEANGEPLQKGDVTVRVTAPSGKGETVRLTSAGDEWGVFTGELQVQEPGKHKVVLFCQQTKGTLETSVFVQGGMAERVGRAARPEVLEEIARVTRGEVFHAEKPQQLVQWLSEIPEPAPSIRRLTLWSDPWVAGTIVTLLGIFWIGRKGAGLI
ncbi:MAG: hypothetical protein U0903_05330 [Planctomycetales bacterium]